jgi:2-polyprenyl-3-methyl-5-hydroxy-6-metoxy-1,4-benzoquinol methylase
MSNEKCDLCNSKNSHIIIDIKKPSLTSDRKIIDKGLKKIQCDNCGLVFTNKRNNFDSIKDYYSKEYKYNSSKKGDSVFFTQTGNQERSEHVLNWIIENISKNDLKNAQTIIEVGCGEGNLLEKFVKKFPKKEIIGFELNKKAITLGKKKGLDIRELSELENIKSDIIISYAVMEHTPSPTQFIKHLSKSLKDNGQLVIGLPHQNKIYYDLFFIDHLYHFTTKHVEEFGRKNNLIQIKKSVGKWPIDSFSIHIFKKANKIISKKINFSKTKIEISFEKYQKKFKKLNKYLEKYGTENEIIVFGVGEFFSILYCYTDLRNAKIKLAIDDFPKDDDFTFEVIPSKNAKNLKEPIIVCVNEKYQNIVLEKICNNDSEIFFLSKKMGKG